MRYSGREFSKEEIIWINHFIKNTPGIYRQALSKRFCEEVNWRKADGGLKDMSCKVAMLKMEKDGLIKLPPRKRPPIKLHKYVTRTLFAEPQAEVTKKAGEFNLEFEIVGKGMSSLWNEYIDRYHYLGYKPSPGAQIRYFVKSDNKILACLGFASAAWKTMPRDQYIDWDAKTREKNLHLIVNNSRYLILPWINSKNLASKILSLTARRLANDWEQRYNYRPVLLETFVEKDRFTGTCYKAANWLYVGDTKGRGKHDFHNECKLPVKSVWLYPLIKNFRTPLTDDKNN